MMTSEDDLYSRADHARKGSPFLTTEQAAAYVGLTRQTLEKMRRKARGPCFRKHGRYVRYHIADLEAWSNANRRLSVGDGVDGGPGRGADDAGRPYG
jgi:excisionase family DNA binding protein